MNTAALLLTIILSGIPSRYTSVSVDISWDGTVKETEVSYRAVSGDDGRFLRVTRDFDPEYMEVELIGAEYGFHGALRDVPEWAVDTLTGAEGWPRALVVAFPGLRPGMDLRWTFRVRERGEMSSQGLFYTYIAGEEPDTIIVTTDDPRGLNAYTRGFTAGTRRGRRVFLSENESFKELWLSTAADWGEVETILLGSSLRSGMETPPDLREASIEAGAAGALPSMRISRGRVLITESLQLLPFPGGDAGFSVRSLQEILDTRRATPVEAATLLSAMCRVMGINAPVVPATDIFPPIPSPLGFFRAFILAEGILEEPSEYLSPVGWVDHPDTLWLLLPGGTLAEMPPEPRADSCSEVWEISPEEGTFTLSLTTGGGFDRELRRKLAGLSPEESLLRVSEWFRSSEIHMYPDSLLTSDLFDLVKPAELTVLGIMPEQYPPWMDKAPALNWNREGAVNRSYPGLEVQGGTVWR